MVWWGKMSARSGQRQRLRRPDGRWWSAASGSSCAALCSTHSPNTHFTPPLTKTTLQPKPRDKRRKQRDGGDAPSDDDAALPADVSAKVLAQARVQQAEVEAEARGTTGLAGRGSRAPTAAAPPADSDDESASSLSDGGGDPWSDGEVEVSPEDEAAIAAFLAPGAADHRQRTLADVILDKLKEQEGAGGEGAGVSG